MLGRELSCTCMLALYIVQRRKDSRLGDILCTCEGEQLRSALPRSSSGLEEDSIPQDTPTEGNPAYQPSVSSLPMLHSTFSDCSLQL